MSFGELDRVPSTYYVVKEKMKIYRWRARRASVALRYGAEAVRKVPAILGNAIPKSGSHLIIQVLHGFAKLGPFVNTGFPPVNRGEDNSKLPPESVVANIERMRPGDIGYGYIRYRRPYIDLLTAPERATVFIYRDPRDMVLSAVKYATYMNPNHGMYKYFNERLNTDEERINVVIQGKEDEPGLEYSDIRTRYENYLGWLNQPEVLSLRFEDLILNRDDALGKIIDYLSGRGFRPEVSRAEAITVLKQSIMPHKSGTFRKGQPGGWKENFTEANKAAFKQVAGDLLVQLGYEQGNDW